MQPQDNKFIPKEVSRAGIPTVSANLSDGRIVELLYDPETEKTAFAVGKEGKWIIEKEINLSDSQKLLPYSGKNNLIENGIVLLPSQPEEYGSEEALQADIRSFIRKYVDVSPLFKKIASYYVLFSWVYDSFNELPYLRLKGDPGSGKTRFLLTIGSLCYKPIFASGASTISPLFRILDAFKGTLIIDESDFRVSDEKAEVVKILNNGNSKGFPVLRSEASPNTKEFNPRAYAVFGPKIIATRGLFEDRALESRCLTEDMGQRRLREDIPINLPTSYKEEALRIRNKLLLFRFRNLKKQFALPELVDRTIEPRLNQIFVPLLSVIEDPKAIADLQGLARTYNQEMLSERGMDTEAQVLEMIQDILTSPESRPSIKDITAKFIEKHGEDYERKITTKWIGYLVRRKLNIKTVKSHGVFVIPLGEHPKLERLYERYGLTTPERSPPSPEVHPPASNPPFLLPPNVPESSQHPPVI
jgi:hypothetical protein